MREEKEMGAPSGTGSCRSDQAADDLSKPLRDYAQWTREVQERGPHHPDSISIDDVDADLLDAAATALQRLTEERDEAMRDRDALRRAAGFKPGPLKGDDDIVLKDIAGMRPAMVKARRSEERAQGDAMLWQCIMAERGIDGTGGLLLKVWEQRKAAEAQVSSLREEVRSLRMALVKAGTGAGAFVSTECTTEFLLSVPTEVHLVIERLLSQLQEARKALEDVTFWLEAQRINPTALKVYSAIRNARSVLSTLPGESQ